MRRRVVLAATVLALTVTALPASAAQTGAVIANGTCVELAHGGTPQAGIENSRGKAIALHRAHQTSDAVYGSLASCEAALP